jgi:integrase
LTVNELVLAYFRHAQVRYVKRGKATSEVSCVLYALRPLRRLYGMSEVADFGPKALKDVRQAMTDAGRCRTSINKDAERVKRMFKWAVGEELLDVSLYQRLKAVERLKMGQSSAAESPGVGPVPVEHVEAVLPLLPPPVAAMVRLQLLTGCRPPGGDGVASVRGDRAGRRLVAVDADGPQDGTPRPGAGDRPRAVSPGGP